jgi:hypothetical protein
VGHFGIQAARFSLGSQLEPGRIDGIIGTECSGGGAVIDEIAIYRIIEIIFLVGLPVAFLHHPPRQKRNKAAYSLDRHCLHRDWNLLRRIAGLLAGTEFDYGSHDPGRIGYVFVRGFLFCALFSTKEVNLTHYRVAGGPPSDNAAHQKS